MWRIADQKLIQIFNCGLEFYLFSLKWLFLKKIYFWKYETKIGWLKWQFWNLLIHKDSKTPSTCIMFSLKYVSQNISKSIPKWFTCSHFWPQVWFFKLYNAEMNLSTILISFWSHKYPLLPWSPKIWIFKIIRVNI